MTPFSYICQDMLLYGPVTNCKITQEHLLLPASATAPTPLAGLGWRAEGKGQEKSLGWPTVSDLSMCDVAASLADDALLLDPVGLLQRVLQGLPSVQLPEGESRPHMARVNFKWTTKYSPTTCQEIGENSTVLYIHNRFPTYWFKGLAISLVDGSVCWPFEQDSAGLI